MKKYLILLLLVLGYFGCSQPQDNITPPDTKQNFILVISWDGAKPSVMKKLLDEKKLPTIQSLMNHGCYTFKAQTVFPSVTLPAHTSMFTGLVPEKHKVFWNEYVKSKGTVESQTVFEIAKKSGYRTAMLFTKEKFWHLVKPNTVDDAICIKENASSVTDAAIKLVKEKNINLIFVHFKDPDVTGHVYGWGNDKKKIPPSREYMAALEACDAATGRLINTVKSARDWKKTCVIITTDHGGHDKGHGTDDPEDMTIPWLSAGGLIESKGALQQTVYIMDTAATVLSALNLPIPKGIDGKLIK